MTCATIFRALIALPDWLTAFFILFVASCFGASAMMLYYEIRYRGGIAYQLRREQIVDAFKSTRRDA